MSDSQAVAAPPMDTLQDEFGASRTKSSASSVGKALEDIGISVLEHSHVVTHEAKLLMGIFELQVTASPGSQHAGDGAHENGAMKRNARSSVAKTARAKRVLCLQGAQLSALLPRSFLNGASGPAPQEQKKLQKVAADPSSRALAVLNEYYRLWEFSLREKEVRLLPGRQLPDGNEQVGGIQWQSSCKTRTYSYMLVARPSADDALTLLNLTDVGDAVFSFDEWAAELSNAARADVEHYYTIGRKIGSGAFAHVYLATSRVTGTAYALKEIDMTHEMNKPELVMAEILVMRSVCHPRLVQMHDVFERPDKVQVVVEYMAGGELYDRIAELGGKGFSERNAQAVFREILQGVEYLHRHRIVHRDLKPENVLCTGTEWPLQVKLCDFGLSSMTCHAVGPELVGADQAEGDGQDSDPPERKIVGTANYVAPETARREMSGAPADMWACGVVLFVILSGKLPFNGKSEEDVIKKVAAAKFTMPPREWRGISPAAKSLVLSLMNADPRKRLSASGALQHAWLQTETSDAPIGNDMSDLGSGRRKFRKAFLGVSSLGRLKVLFASQDNPPET
ncbi:Myosin light chain kinase A [Porphyridium purpureum]|uniref:Myosin light chain kinase A n=1 Tax=Porphyridium purpureum TaxID=35688 RepID=A0A5J4YSQ5_PORPP|nr:Myosin light chain kinase A [Porphyridium purpureum]|eukprot:POR5475..scf227_4